MKENVAVTRDAATRVERRSKDLLLQVRSGESSSGTDTTKKGLFLAVFLAGGFLSPTTAEELFFENFESGLTRWNTHSGEVVEAPVDASTHGQAVHFKNNWDGGDTFISQGFALTPGVTYRCSLDYLGLAPSSGGFGAISLSGTWVATDPEWVFRPSGGTVNMLNDGQWHTYSFEFTAPWQGGNTVYLALEQWAGFGGPNPPTTAYFDNILLRRLPELATTNGIPHWWLIQYNQPTNDTAEVLDPDNDKADNLAEWTWLTNPTNGNAFPRIAIASTNEGTVCIVFPQTFTNREYSLSRTNRLKSGFPSPFTNFTGVGGPKAFDIEPMPGAAWFYSGGASVK